MVIQYIYQRYAWNIVTTILIYHIIMNSMHDTVRLHKIYSVITLRILDTMWEAHLMLISLPSNPNSHPCTLRTLAPLLTPPFIRQQPCFLNHNTASFGPSLESTDQTSQCLIQALHRHNKSSHFASWTCQPSFGC
jgi:hypothetical protein